MDNSWQLAYRDYDPTVGDVVVFGTERIVCPGRAFYDHDEPSVIGEIIRRLGFSRSHGPFIVIGARHRSMSNSWSATVILPDGLIGTIEWPITTNIRYQRCNAQTGVVD